MMQAAALSAMTPVLKTGDSSNELVISGSTSTGFSLVVELVLSLSLIVISL